MAHYAQLTSPQRYALQALLEQGCPRKTIAAQLHVDAATITRELQRNGGDDPKTTYCPKQAQERTRQRRQRTPYKLKEAVEQQVIQGLRERHSPQQISGRPKQQAGQSVVSHETIYRYVYRQKATDNEPLTSYLRIRHRKRYKKRGQPQQRGGIPHRVGIEHRRAIVETNTQVGHWEADTIIGKDHQGVLLTLVERVTKYVLIVKLATKEAAPLAKAAVRALLHCGLPTLTITFDNGKEFARHEWIGLPLGARTYFADPQSSGRHPAWQRGLNENTNGLIRQYIPKGCHISLVSPCTITWVQHQLNDRPRKGLGFLTPAQLARSQ